MLASSILFDNIVADVNSLDVTWSNSIFRLVLSVLLGMVVGYERKRKGQIAGIRTFALMSMGACLAMLLSIYVPQVYLGLKNGDPSRIAAQVITGVGFIGAGAMIQNKGAVRGLTTAAGIWITAIIGMAIGVGMYLCGIVATILCVIILICMEQAERVRHIGADSKVLNVTTQGIITDITPYRTLFKEKRIHLSTFYVEYDYENNLTMLNFIILIPTKGNLLPVIEQMRRLEPTKSITLTSQTDI